MLEVRGRADFLDEAFTADGGDDGRVHDFERDLPIVPEVARQVDGRHAARTQLAFDTVAAGERGGELFLHRGHVARAE